MRKAQVLGVCVVAFTLGGGAVRAADPSALESLRFLIGDWEAQGGGKPGEAKGGFRFTTRLQGRVIERTSYAEYPATGDKPSSRHDDLMVLYVTEAGEIRADYYDSEGHVIHYLGSRPGEGQLTLVSEPLPSAPRFRLGYRLAPDGGLEGRFEVAPPGKPDSFAPYLSWTARRKGTGR